MSGPPSPDCFICIKREGEKVQTDPLPQRLDVLREKVAYMGRESAPHDLMEIVKIEAQIKALRPAGRIAAGTADRASSCAPGPSVLGSPESVSPARKVKIFCSYAHADEGLRGELEVHLAPLRRDGMIQIWHDASINPGHDLAKVIDRELAAAEVILLLVSPAFIASDYCWEIEMKEAIRRHRAGTATALPVILRPADWTTAPFRPLLAVPRDGLPVTQWSDRDAAWTDVVLGIRRAVEERLGTAASTPRPTVKDSI